MARGLKPISNSAMSIDRWRARSFPLRHGLDSALQDNGLAFSRPHEICEAAIFTNGRERHTARGAVDSEAWSRQGPPLTRNSHASLHRISNLSFQKDAGAIRTPALVAWAAPKGRTERDLQWGISMLRSVGNTARSDRGHLPPKTSLRDVKNANTDWLRDHAKKLSAKDGQKVTGLNPKAFENLRQGRNKINFDNLVEWCRNDPQFAAAFAEHIGLVLPGEAEFAGALTHAVNAYWRRKSRELEPA